MEEFKWNIKCRLCGVTEAETLVMVDLFSSKEFVNKVNKILPISITDDNLLPQRICYRCHHKVEELIVFQERCVQIQNAYQEELNAYKGTTKEVETPPKEFNQKKRKISDDDTVKQQELKPLQMQSNKVDDKGNHRILASKPNNKTKSDIKTDARENNASGLHNNKLHTESSTTSKASKAGNDSTLIPEYLMVTNIPLAGTVYTCLHCEQTFVNQTAACKHRCEQLDELLRDEGSEEEASIESSNEDQQSANSDFPYVCEICNRCFSRNASLLAHQSSHIVLDYDSDRGGDCNDGSIYYGQRKKRRTRATNPIYNN